MKILTNSSMDTILFIVHSLVLRRHALDDIGVTCINNAEAANSVIFSTCSPQVHIVAIVVVNSNLRQHSVILYLRLPKRWAIIGNDDQLPFGISKRFKDGLITQSVFATLHDECQPVVDALMSLLGLLGGHHIDTWLH